MLQIMLIDSLVIAVSVFAYRRGGAPERLMAILLPISAVVTLVVGAFPRHGFRGVEYTYLAVDLLALVGFSYIALRANRWWPLWFASFHLLALCIHGVRGIDPSILPIVYTRLTGYMVLPMCLALALGTQNYRRNCRVASRPPSDWSPFRW